MFNSRFNKIQTYEPKDITLNKDYGNFQIKKAYGKGKIMGIV